MCSIVFLNLKNTNNNRDCDLHVRIILNALKVTLACIDLQTTKNKSYS